MRDETRAVLISALLCVSCPAANAQQPTADAIPPVTEDDDATTMETIRVTAPRLATPDLYVSKPVERTPPTVFDNAWREPVNLEKIGDNGGVVPLLVNYAVGKVAEGARMIPGWKGPAQAAVARPPPLSDDQALRALRLQEAAAGGQ